MPRDANGNYTLPVGNPVITDTTVESSWANTTMEDLRIAMSDSLSRSGDGAMLGPLRFVDGTASLPSVSFLNELGLGFFRKAAGVIGITGQGNEFASFDANTGNATVSGKITNFKSTGITDIATGEKFRLSDAVALWGSGVAGSNWVHYGSVSDGSVYYCGGSSAGASSYIRLYGEDHANAGDSLFYSPGGNLWQRFNELAGSWTLYTGSGGGIGTPKTLALTIDASQKATFPGEVVVGGRSVSEFSPTGSIIMWPKPTAPDGYLICNGAAVSRTTYAGLFAVLSDDYGNGNGSTTFNLPDMRGQFVRGLNAGSGVDPDAASRTDRGDGTTGDAVGTKQVDAFKSHTHKRGTSQGVSGGAGFGTNTAVPGTIDTGDTGGNETRPTNIAMVYCIKT